MESSSPLTQTTPLSEPVASSPSPSPSPVPSSAFGALDVLVRRNLMPLKRRLGMRRLLQLLDVLDEPQKYPQDELEQWARRTLEGLLKYRQHSESNCASQEPV